MKFLHLSTLLTVSLLFFSGCEGISPRPPEKTVIDKTLPIIQLTQRGVITDMNSVAFEWKSIKHDTRVEGIYIYKRSPENKNPKAVQYYDTITNRFSTHYVDNNVKPNTHYTYAFRAFSKDAEANQSKNYTLSTLPVLHSVAWIHSISGMPRSAKIIWRPDMSKCVKSYIVERKILDDKEWKKLAELRGHLHAEYIDQDLDDNQVYMYRVRVKTFDNIVSTPSETVKAVTKPLPPSVTHLQATKNLPKKIKIKWQDTTQKDFYRYHLYRSDEVDGSYELIAKLFNNHFTDKISKDGKAYFYRVSVIDKDGLESIYDQNTIMGMTLAKPATPTLLGAIYLGDKIEITWNTNDTRAKTFIVQRRYRAGWFKEKFREFKGLRGSKFIDTDIKPNSTYTYSVYSVDINGIKSKESVKVSIKTPESSQIVQAEKENIIEEKVVQPTNKISIQEVVEPVQNLNVSED